MVLSERSEKPGVNWLYCILHLQEQHVVNSSTCHVKLLTSQTPLIPVPGLWGAVHKWTDDRAIILVGPLFSAISFSANVSVLRLPVPVGNNFAVFGCLHFVSALGYQRQQNVTHLLSLLLWNGTSKLLERRKLKLQQNKPKNIVTRWNFAKWAFRSLQNQQTKVSIKVFARPLVHFSCCPGWVGGSTGPRNHLNTKTVVDGTCFPAEWAVEGEGGCCPPRMRAHSNLYDRHRRCFSTFSRFWANHKTSSVYGRQDAGCYDSSNLQWFCIFTIPHLCGYSVTCDFSLVGWVRRYRWQANDLLLSQLWIVRCQH